MDKVILNNGAEYGIVSFALASVGYLFIRVNMTLAEAATVFGNAENAARIEFHPAYNGSPICILGFSQLDYIVNEGDCVRVALKQPVQYEEVHIND